MNAAARAVYLCDGVRTPFGRYRGGLAMVRDRRPGRAAAARS